MTTGSINNKETVFLVIKAAIVADIIVYQQEYIIKERVSYCHIVHQK